MRKALAALALLSASVTAADLPLIPLPKEMKAGEGSFVLSPQTGIRFDAALAKEAEILAFELQSNTGSRPQTVREEARIMLPSEIRLDIDNTLGLEAGGYTLEATPKGIVIKGKDATGAWYGTRTLLQMLPMEGPRTIPAITIKDEPRFGWRGVHLDVGRHFFPVENIKGLINWLAFHKFNTFHWHLTEDQGWRIEVKKYPKLTEVGAWRDSTPPYGNRNSDDGKRYGGFYTQEQIKEVVAYAKERHITIVPEIDMPGHMAAAIAAYPEFGNSDIPNYAPKVITRWGVHPYTLAPTEETFGFVDDVLTELCALFPSEYIHIGGDEAPKGQWEQSPRVQKLMKKEGLKNGHDVQSYFIKRVEKILEKKGRKLVGWDEIREGGLAPSATVMCWQGDAVKAAVDSVREGHDVIMAPNQRLYFDHYQRPEKSELAKGAEFETIGGFRPVSNVYDYKPVPTGLTPEQQKHVLGVQAQLWTEYMHDWKKVEYMAFPRIAALAEVAWTPEDKKNYESFRGRLDGVMKFYDAAKVNRAEPYDPPKRETADGSTVTTSLGIYQEHWPEFAFDGKPETFFWANRELKENDHFTIAFKEGKGGNVTVKTGGDASQNGDKLESGVLEASPNGSAWIEIAEFENGIAEGTLPAGTKQLRIHVTKPQKNWLIIQDIEIGK